MPTVFVQQDWRSQISATPRWKLLIYRLARPMLQHLALRKLGEEYRLGTLTIAMGERGFPLEQRRSWVDSHHRIEGATVLIQGTGTGWDVVGWAKYRPKAIIAVDMYPFAGWLDVRSYVADVFGVDVIFLRTRLESLPIRDNSVDIVASDAVWEHCRDLASVLRETGRVLQPDGFVYASYGPLWHSAGGDHFSGRGGLEHVFNHIRLSSVDYLQYYETYKEPIEDFQSGGRYIELDLFSKLTTRQYLDCFSRAGLKLSGLILEISGAAFRYERLFPYEFQQMITSDVSPDDILIKTNLVLLRPGL